MDSAKRQWQLQIIQEQRIEADAKTRRLQLEEQIERSEQVQRPVHDVSGQAPGWPVPWHAPPPGAAYGAGQYGHQWHQTQQGPVAVWIPMQGRVAGQAIPVQVIQHGQFQGSAAEHTPQRQFSQAPPSTAWAQQAAATEGQPSEAARPAMGPQSPPGDWQHESAQMGHSSGQWPRAGQPRDGREGQAPAASSWEPIPQPPCHDAVEGGQQPERDGREYDVLTVDYDYRVAERSTSWAKWSCPMGPGRCQNVAAPRGTDMGRLSWEEIRIAKILVGHLRHEGIVALPLQNFMRTFELQE